MNRIGVELELELVILLLADDADLNPPDSVQAACKFLCYQLGSDGPPLEIHYVPLASVDSRCKDSTDVECGPQASERDEGVETLNERCR